MGENGGISTFRNLALFPSFFIEFYVNLSTILKYRCIPVFQVQNIMQLAGATVDLLDVQGSSVMICLEDGWDCTTQVMYCKICTTRVMYCKICTQSNVPYCKICTTQVKYSKIWTTQVMYCIICTIQVMYGKI